MDSGWTAQLQLIASPSQMVVGGCGGKAGPGGCGDDQRRSDRIENLPSIINLRTSLIR